MRRLRPAEKQWLFSEDALLNTPSRLDGVSLQDELEGRKQTIAWIRSLWLRVAGFHGENDPESTPAKGIVTCGAALVHRFFMRRSINDFEPKILAPTILFLSSKIEEGPMRLRHIVNACLQKFEPGAPIWDPQGDNDAQPLEYKRWEKEILAAEEVALEALCFDMAIEQPWPVLRRSIRGLDALCNEAESSATAEARVNGHSAKGKSRATEQVVDELAWTFLNEGFLSPLPVMHAAPILAFTTFVLVLAAVDEMPLSSALATASDLGPKFELDIQFCPDAGARGEDVQSVRGELLCRDQLTADALRQYVEWCEMGIIDKDLIQYFKPEPTEPGPYRRLYEGKQSNGTTNGEQVEADAADRTEKMDVDS